MTAQSFNHSFGYFGNSTSKKGSRRALTFSIALLTVFQLAFMPVALAGDNTPVKQAMAAAAQGASASTASNPQATSTPATSLVTAPSVPASSSVLTPAVASSLAKVVNAQQLVINVGDLQNGVYAVTGNFVNTSNLVFVSTNSNIHSATLSVTGSIFNPVGASITTVIPSGIANAVANLNLVLQAQTAIYNAGSIISAGTLSMKAPTIVNALPSTALASSQLPVMQSLTGNLSMQTSTLVNQGIIAAAVGNINIANLTNNLAVNALGGTFNAAGGLGIINIGTQNITDQLNLQILGGDFVARALNITAGSSGQASLQINSLCGVLNVTALDAYIGCNTGTLTLGNIYVGGDPYTSNSNGDIVFTGVTDVANISLYTPDSVLSQGASSILSQTGITIDAGKNIDLTGVTSITGSGNISLVAEAGYITIPGVHIASNGGNISLVAYHDVNLDGSGSPSVIDSSASGSSAGGPGGHIFLVSQAGNVNIGTGSQVTTGAMAPVTSSGASGGMQYAVTMAAYGGIVAGDVIAPGGNIVMASGVSTTGSESQGWIVHVFDGTQQSFSAGGITAASISNCLSSTGSNTLLYVNATNGALALNNVTGDGGTVNVLSTGDLTIQQGITNTSKASAGGTVVAGANGNLSISNGIVNDAVNGSGGTVSVSAGMVDGLTVSGSSGNLFISDNAFSDGGTVSCSNFGPLTYMQGGIQATAAAGNGTNVTLETFASQGTGSSSPLTINGKLAVANASANGNGGSVQLISNGDLNISGAVLNADGSGSGNGSSLFQLVAGGNLNATGATVTANGGNNGSGGSILANANTYTGGGFTMSANGNGAGTGGNVCLSLVGNGAFNSGDVLISARGANGGSVSFSAGGNLSVNTSVFNVSPIANGNGGSVNLASSNGVLNVTGNINADGAGSGNGGSIVLNSGGSDFALGSGGPQLFARGGTEGGNGGSISISSGGDLTLASDSVANVNVRAASGNGGTLYLAAGNNGAGSLTVNSNLSVNGAGSGSGGTIAVQSQAGGNNQGAINLNGNLSACAGATGQAGGSVTVSMMASSDMAGPAINVNGNINADAGDSGTGGSIYIYTSGDGNAVNIGASSAPATVSAQGGQGGGTIYVATFNNADINVQGGSSLLAGSTSGNGGMVIASAAGNLTVDSTSSTIDASSAAASGGQITLAAGASGTGALNINGNVAANGAGSNNNASITLSQNSAQSMQIGVSPGDGLYGIGTVSATNQSGTGGTLNLSNGGSDLNVALNESVSLQGAQDSSMGTVNASSTGNVNISGAAPLNGSLNGSGSSYYVFAGGASTIGIKQVSSTGGNITVKAGNKSGAIVFSAGSNVSAAGGAIEIGAPVISFAGASTFSMDNAGILKIDSGTQGSSLTLNFAPDSTVTFNVTQGTSLRPGTIAIGPSGSGALSLNGKATLDFTGGTVSLTSSGGAVSLGSALSINSDSFDSTQNLGMEILATNGDINLNATIAARQLNVSTTGGGNINLGAEINAPTVLMSVDGSSSISQASSGSIGIGTLVLQSGSGNIGSAASPLSTNVLELQVTSSGSVYINNASTVDLKTSTVAKTFQLNNQGDIACENAISAGTLNMTAASGSISIYNAVKGTAGVTLSASGTGSNINIEAGIQLASAGGNIALSTDSLVLDGNILLQGASAQMSVTSGSDLKLSGAGGQIVASGSNSFISISAASSVTFSSSYVLNAGATGLVQVQTTSLSGAGVILASSSKLTSAGGSQLNIYSNALTFGSGSSVSLTGTTIGMSVQSTAGAGLTVNVGGPVIGVNSLGGSVQFVAGTGGALTFKNSGNSANTLSVSGATLYTSSSAADTTLSQVNLTSSGNIQVTVSGANLNLNGNSLTSSKAGAVIVLQDPDGITLNGGGTIGFSQGVSGSILVQALSQSANLQINSATQFNAGSSGSVSFVSAGSVLLADGSASTVSSGASVSIKAPVIAFGSGSQLVASGASAISLSSDTSLTVTLSGSATVSTNGGASISVSAAAGSPITFSQSASGTAATLNLLGAPVTISTANANVTVNSNVALNCNNNVTVQTPGGTLVNNGQIIDAGSGTTTVIKAAGNLVINKNVSANNLIIETTGNNGNITLSADVNVLKALTVSAIGRGNIIQTGGLLSAESISLVSQYGQIGSAGSPIKVKTADLTVSTGGKAYVSAQGAVRLDSYTVAGGLHLNATGNISVGALNAVNVAINSSAVFDAGAGNTVSIAASKLISIDAGLTLRVKESALKLSAAQITLGQASKLRAAGGMNITGNLSGKDFSLSSKQGNLQISGQLSGRKVDLSTGADGNITLAGNMSASDLAISAGGKGNIVQTSGVLSATNLLLASGRGNIGSSSKFIQVSADNLTAQTGNRGTVNISAAGNLIVDDSYAGGNFSLSATGAVTAGNITSLNGSISLSGSGAMQVARGAVLLACEGNLTIQNTDSQKGTITIGKNATLVALSDSATNGLGNVRIFIGSLPANPVKGSKPAGLGLSQLAGGVAYFGSNGITVQGSKNQVDAWGSNVIFSSGSRPASAIVLEGGVFILADPPVAASGMGQALPATLALPAVRANMAIILPSVTQPGFVPMPVQDTLKNVLSDVESAKDVHEVLRPVACVTAVTSAAAQARPALKNMVERGAANTVYARGASYEADASSLTLDKGEILIDARVRTEVKTAGASVLLAPGACAILKSDGQGMEVYNLCELHQGAVKVTLSDRQLYLAAGQRLVTGQRSQVAVRHENTLQVAGKTIRTAEFPFLSLVTSSDVLKQLTHSTVKEDRQLSARLFKMAACLTLVTSAHGAFRQ